MTEDKTQITHSNNGDNKTTSKCEENTNNDNTENTPTSSSSNINESRLIQRYNNNTTNGRNNLKFKVPKIEELDPCEKKSFNTSSQFRMRDYHSGGGGTGEPSALTEPMPWNNSHNNGTNYPPNRNTDLMRPRKGSNDGLLIGDSNTASTGQMRVLNERHHFPTISGDTKPPHPPRQSSTDKSEYARNMSHLSPAAEYIANYRSRGGAAGHNSESNEQVPATPASLRSTVLNYPSRNSGFSSPRHSNIRGKKRMLSVSPIASDLIDLNGVIRTSPNSLVAYVINNEIQGFASRGSGGRNSSAASHGSRGSYGHLSASKSPSSQGFHSRQKNYFATPTTPLQEKPVPMKVEEPSLPPHQPHQSHQPHQYHPQHHPPPHPQPRPLPEPRIPVPPPSTTQLTTLQNKFQAENNQDECFNSPASNTTNDSTETRSCVADGDSADDEDGEESLQNFQCLWKDCGLVLDSQQHLVSHVNTIHIQKNKKDCTCYWQSCTREEKPFKAMYMLVVHVRRHTGEKPHKCHYENCTKAYSRLENLKTHLRSHTGERPYVCEVTGCQKAFSNASDRAKHQNRTHSTVKQYACKVPGCPKRYTDPSSLRKHMKTVHGALPQPTKKLKGDGGQARNKEDAPSSNLLNENKEKVDKTLNARVKSETKCKTSKKLQHISTPKHDKSPSYPVSSVGNCVMMLDSRVGYESQSHSTNSHYMNMQKMWNHPDNVNSTGSINVERKFVDMNNNNADMCNPIMHSAGADLQVQMPPPAMHTFGSLVKPVEQSIDYTNKRLLGNNSMKPPRAVGARRGSNGSTGSIDSNYTSGVDTYNGSRRGSDVSIQSHLSGGRRSTVPAASPLPSRNLSPSRIRQTVIEGEVLENYKESTSPPNLNLIQDTPDQYMREVSNGINDHYQINHASRLSSGYGSRQNIYFSAKNSARESPAFPMTNRNELRRASDSAVKGLNECGFYGGSSQVPSPLRRGSEPANIADIIDSTPRRHSLSGFKLLPIPPAMQQTLPNDNQPILPNIPHLKQKNEFVPCTCTAQTPTTMQYNMVDSHAQKMMMNRTMHQQQTWNMDVITDQMPPPQPPNFSNFNMQSNMDFTNGTSFPALSKTGDNLPPSYSDSIENMQTSAGSSRRDRNMFTNFVGKYHMEPKKGLHNNPAGHSMYTNNNTEMMDQNFNQQFLFNQLNMTDNNPALYPQNEIVNPQSYLNPLQPANEDNLFLYPQNPPPSELPCNDKQGFSSTLQWRNSHFGQKIMEPEGGDEKDLENMMIRSLGALTTEPCDSRLSTAPSNMTVTNMDALLNSFVVEDSKFFETQTFNKYP